MRHMFPSPEQIRAKRPSSGWLKGTLLAFDPGETTGYSVWESTEDAIRLVNAGQLKTWPFAEGVRAFASLLDCLTPQAVVFESYNIYGWKTEQHSNSNVPTIQVIGCLQTLLLLREVPMFTQTAQTAKMFVTDDKLKAWGFYERGQRHARDSMRHALFFLMFGPSEAQKKTS